MITVSRPVLHKLKKWPMVGQTMKKTVNTQKQNIKLEKEPKNNHNLKFVAQKFE